jgi:ribosomal protein L11 methyltransferase
MESSIKPVYIKNRIIIYPSWKKDSVSKERDKILIEIDPKMSFGTGHNDTTQLILEMMYDLMGPNDVSMLDYGCGTSILAIAAIKLGLKKAVSIDIDDDAIENAKENIRKNKVERQISLHKSEINKITESEFDIICANLTSSVVLVNLNYIADKLRTGGKLFVTGILVEEKDEMGKTLIKNNFEIKEIRHKGEWCGFYCLLKN